MRIGRRLTLGFLIPVLIACIALGGILMQSVQLLEDTSSFYQFVEQSRTTLDEATHYLQLLDAKLQTMQADASQLQPSHETLTNDRRAIQALTTLVNTTIQTYIQQDQLDRHANLSVLLKEAGHGIQLSQQHTLLNALRAKWQIYDRVKQLVLEAIDAGQFERVHELSLIQGEPAFVGAVASLQTLTQFNTRLGTAIHDATRFEVERVLLVGAFAFLSILVGVGIVGWLVSSTLVQRLHHLRRFASSIEQGQFDARLTIRGSDEIADVSTSVNSMLDTIVGLLEVTRQQQDTQQYQHQELLRQHEVLNEANACMKSLVTTDSLTGLSNRMMLLTAIAAALPIAEQTGSSMALLMLDLDRFKEVNDTYGHQLGDQLLQQVGARLQQAIGTAATVARLGGDEFAVFLSAADEASARQLALVLCTAIEEAFLVEGYLLQVEVSIGIALYPTHGTDPLTLFRHADVAMYIAKRGHERCALYDASRDQDSRYRLALLGDLRKAIATHELRLFYQPKAELKTGLITSVEALVRWQHPVHGFIPPDQFIPLAEQTGLITPLTHWVVETAIAQCRCWLDNGLKLVVAVNLSMWNLRDANLPDTIASLLTRYNVPPHLLRCEITESAVMADATHTLQILNRLFALGVHIAIDDYGTGYASLSYLKYLPADELKIDRSFVQHLTTDAADQAIVRSTVNMAHSMGMQVVAEGVEDQATWDLLVSLKCDIAQGYYLSRPIPAQDIECWLDERKEAAAQLLNEGKEAVVL